MILKGFIYSLIMWCILAVLAIGNGTLREFGIKQFVGDPWANHISVATAIVIIFFATYIFFRIFKSMFHLKDAVLIGFCWVVLTMAFEFLFGHYVAAKPWKELFQQYNLASGNLWVIALITIGLSPIAALKMIRK